MVYKSLLIIFALLELQLCLLVQVGPRYERYNSVKNTNTPQTDTLNSNSIMKGVSLRHNTDMQSLLYADNDLLVYNKPANVLSVPGLHEKDSLAKHIAHTWGLHRVDKMIVHRLDYATSGVLCFARNEAALRMLHNQFRRKEVRKYYRAVVYCSGKDYPSALQGEIRLPIVRDIERGSPFHCIRDPDGVGKQSLTLWTMDGYVSQSQSQSKYESIISHSEEKGDFMKGFTAMLCMEPRTGRTHQLRIHASATGMPIHGDSFYAPDDVASMAPRLLLHAERLCLVHPFSGRPMQFRAECPFSLN